MARYTNSSKSIIKLQALIRGYLVRKKFSQLKCDYNEIVKSFEGNWAKVRWKDDSKLCLPIVDRDCSDTREGVEVLTDDVPQKNSREKIDLNVEKYGLNDSNTFERISPTQTANDIVASVNCSSKTVPNSDVESTDDLNNSTPKDFGSSVNNCTFKDCLDLNKGLNKVLDSTCNSNSSSTKTINHSVMAQENQVKIDKKRQTDIVDEGTCNGPNKDQIFYPNDKTSLIKLREDLTMELLWIEQAIESRINYLALKENMDKQLKDN